MQQRKTDNKPPARLYLTARQLRDALVTFPEESLDLPVEVETQEGKPRWFYSLNVIDTDDGPRTPLILSVGDERTEATIDHPRPPHVATSYYNETTNEWEVRK